MLRGGLGRLAGSTIVYSASATANRFLALLMLPLFTRFLTPSDYGVTSIISVLSLLLGGLFTLGAPSAMSIFLASARQEGERATLVWTTATLLAFTGSLMAAVLVAVAEPIGEMLFANSEHTGVIRLAMLTLAAQSVTTVFSTYFTVSEMRRVVVQLSLAGTATTLGMNVLFVAVFQRGVGGYFEAGLIAAAITLAVQAAVLMRSLGPAVEANLVPRLLRTGLPGVAGLSAFFVIDYSDRFIVQRISGSEELGRYSVGYTFGMAILIAVRGFSSAWPPYFLAYSDYPDQARDNFGQVLKYYVAAAGLISLGFFWLARPMVELFTDQAFYAAYSVIGLVALAYALRGMYLILLPGIYFAKRLHIQSIVEWLSAGTMVGLCLLLVPLYRKEGAAIATCAAYFVLSILAHILGRQYLRVRYPWRRICGIGLTFSVLAGVMTYVAAVSSIGTILLTGAGAIGVYAVVVAFVVFEKDERATVARRILSFARL